MYVKGFARRGQGWGVEAGMCRAGRVGDSPSNNGTSEGLVDRMRVKTKS